MDITEISKADLEQAAVSNRILARSIRTNHHKH